MASTHGSGIVLYITEPSEKQKVCGLNSNDGFLGALNSGNTVANIASVLVKETIDRLC